MELKDLNNNEKMVWCPGCGDYGILNSLKRAITQLGVPQKDIVLVAEVGCSSKLPYYVRGYSFVGLHGRSVPVAQGIKMVNDSLTVIAFGGDGGQYGEGTNHLIHAIRRDLNITLIVHNNQVYGLTTGQHSPTSQKEYKSKAASQEQNALPNQLNPIALALAAGARFVARSFAGDMNHLVNTIKVGVEHKGFSFIDVLQPCVTYNYINTYEWYKTKVYDLQKENFDVTNKVEAYKKAEEWDEKIPIGIIYKKDLSQEESKRVYVKDDILNIDISNLMKEFK